MDPDDYVEYDEQGDRIEEDSEPDFEAILEARGQRAEDDFNARWL